MSCSGRSSGVGGWYSSEAAMGCSKPAEWLGFGLSGATPEQRESQEIRRASGAARCADKLAQGLTRWSIPVPARKANATVTRAVARSFAAGEQSVTAIEERCERLLGRRWRWIGPLSGRYLRAFADETRPRHRAIERFLAADEGFCRARLRHANALRVTNRIPDAEEMQPVAAAAGWDLPSIVTGGDLAVWLGLDYGRMLWLADRKDLSVQRPEASRLKDPLRHYHYRVVGKEAGGIRLIEAPKRRLKEAQRRVLAEILERVPAHPAAHGFVKGRSIRSFAGPHVGQAIVLRMDLQDFFPSFSAARIQALFRTAGYPEAVADLLAGLVTTSAPVAAWQGCGAGGNLGALREARRRYRRRHLPQGAPTSPALANLCSFRLDCRLSGLAEIAGATYTRYADDLAFSGNENFARGIDRFSTHVAAVLRQEGFQVHHRKTRIMRRSVRQYLAGLVINERLNVPRKDFDNLKATLTNCVRHGPEGQNLEGHPAFRAHLEGRVGFVASMHPGKGSRLRAILDRIAW